VERTATDSSEFVVVPPCCARRNGRRRPFPHGSFSRPQYRAGQAGGAAAAVYAEFVGWESADIECGLTEAGVCLFIFFDGQQALFAECQDVAGQRVALGGGDFDEVECAGLEQLDGLDCQPWKIDQRRVFIEQADQRHQVQARGWARAVGQGRGENLHSLGREQIADLLNARGIGAVALADEQSFRVEPDHVSGFGSTGKHDCAERRDVQGLKKRGVARTFGYAIGLAGTEHDQSVIGGKGCVVRVDGVE